MRSVVARARSLTALSGLLLFTACEDRATPPTAPAESAAPKKATATLPTFLASAKPGEPVTLDATDAAQKKFLQDEFEGTPLTAVAAPQLHKVVDGLGAPPPTAKTLKQQHPPEFNTAYDLVDVVNFSLDSAGNAQATGIASAVGRSTFVNAVLRIVDADTGEALGAPASASSFLGVDAHMTAKGTRKSPGQKVAARLTVVFSPYSCPAATVDCVPRPGHELLGSTAPQTQPALTAHVSGASYAQTMLMPVAELQVGAAATGGSVISPASPPVITAPVTPTDGGILVCLGRMPSGVVCSPDGGVTCTYCDNTQGPTAKPMLRIPISGTVALRNPTTSTPTLTAFSSYMVPSTGGGCTSYQTSSTSNQFTSLGGGATVAWSYGSSSFDVSKWAQYGQLTGATGCWTNGGAPVPINWYFNFTVQDTLGNTVPVTITTVGPPSANTAVAQPTSLAYGCVAAGTPIAMADGKTKPIEKVLVGEFVKSAGANRRVLLTYIGNEYLPMYRIATDHGTTVELTRGHPVLMPGDRVVLASRLKVGDAVQTLKGPAKITKIETVPPKPNEGARVFNLDIGDADGGKPALTETNRAFFAGGLLVGDNFMQSREGRILGVAGAEGNALPVPPEWATDYATARKLAAENK